MTSKSTSADNSDPRLEQVLAEYLHSVEAGKPLDGEEIIAKHPDLADELRSYFDNRLAMERLIAPLKGAAEEPTIGILKEAANAASGTRVRYLGDYELLEEIARGGMGVVYKARQVSLNRIVAVKMILAGTLADESAVRRFRQEAEAAANLDHPCIVPVYEVGEHQGQQYFSMGFVQGQSLAAKLAGGPLAPHDAAQLLEQVARAVQYAHERGVIHRDLKPANVLLDQQGRPRVTDFGLAKVAAREQSLTDTGQVLGTPGYMPPEQVDGKEIGAQADVYGLGAILYALLTGRPPFQAATPLETMLQVRSADAAPPRQLNPGVPRDLNTIVMKCLEKCPAGRYQSARDLADDLSRFVDGEPIRARRPTLVEHGMRWLTKQQRSVLTAAAATAISGLMIIGAIFGTMTYQKSLVGHVKFDTDHSRMVAEVRTDVESLVIDPFTVPTENSVALREGEYRVRATAKQLLSDDFLLQVDRGAESFHKISLESRQLWPDFAVDEKHFSGPTNGTITWQLVHCRGPGQPAHLLVLSGGSEVQFELRDMQIDKPVWSVKQSVPPELDLASRDKWLSSQGGLGGFQYHPSGIGASDFRPYVLPEAPHLDDEPAAEALPSDNNTVRPVNGRRMGEIVIALRHQPALLAYSSEDGHRLWCYAPEFSRAPTWGDRQPTPWWFGTVVGEPLVVPDLDGDGVVDFIVGLLVLQNISVADDGQPISLKDQPRRTIDAVSGKTGKRIWQYELDDRWFDLAAGTGIPWANRWFAAPPSSETGGSAWSSPFGNTFRNYTYRTKGDGEEVFRPCAPLLVRQQDKHIVACVAGTRAVALDMRTGKPLVPPHNVGFAPIRPPQVADLNGDGDEDLVLVERHGPSTFQIVSSQPAGQQMPAKQRLWAWSPTKQNMLWPAREQVADFEKHVQLGQPQPDWPLVADLNGDGRSEIVAPNGTSTDFQNLVHDSDHRAWGGIELIEGASGNMLWNRQLQTVDQQVDRLVIGPDIDGDGWRDVFAATFFARSAHQDSSYVFVDALSGQNGRSLWQTGHPLESGKYVNEFLNELQWWNASADGWPQLIVGVLESAHRETRQLFMLSAGSGVVTHESKSLSPPIVADGDGDGVDDLLCFEPTIPLQLDRGGVLHSFRGASPQLWRRLGGHWQAGSDYDGDGWDDAVSTSNEKLAVLSGRTGRELWRSRPKNFGGLDRRIPPLSVDLDGDGTGDIFGLGHAWNEKQLPLTTLSGKTGHVLWQADLWGHFAELLLLEWRDLDSDGKPEVVFMAAMSLQGDDGSPPSHENSPVWLVVLDGRTGKLRWKEMLCSQHLFGSRYREYLAITYGDLNGDGVLDLVAPGFQVPNLADRMPEIRSFDGKSGQPMWAPISLGGATVPVGFGHYTDCPIPLAEDIDGDGKPEILLQECVQKSPQEYVFCCRVLEGQSGQPRWTHEFPTVNSSMFVSGPAEILDRPRPLVIQRDEKKRAVALWNWWGQPYDQSGDVVLLDSAGKVLWRFNVDVGGPLHRTFRVWNVDMTGDGRDELVLVNGNALECLEVATRERLWRRESNITGGTTILSVHAATDTLPAMIDVLVGRSLASFSGRSGQLLWTCTGLPGSYEPPSVLYNINGSFPPAILAETQAGGDTICLQATPTSDSPFTAYQTLLASVTAPRDPRFARYLPWQGHDIWPLNSPAWIAMGLLFFLPILIVLPSWSLNKIVWQRRGSRQFWLLFPLVVLLFLIALAVPIPSDTPPISPLRARFLVAFWLLPIAAFPWQIVSWFRAGRIRRMAWWLGIALMSAILMGAMYYTIHWRLTPDDEYWVLDASFSLPFLLGLYFAATISVMVTVVENCLWQPLMNFFQRRRISQT